ncbi:hypothetical protein RCCGEPOP_10887, partial [Rhizobium sp. Pop5]
MWTRPAKISSSWRRARQRLVENADISTETSGHPGGVKADDTTADDRNPGRQYARHAAKQDAETAIGLLQSGRARLDRQASCH